MLTGWNVNTVCLVGVYLLGTKTVWTKSLLNRLQTIQSSAAGLRTRSSRRSHITQIVTSLHWLPVGFKFHFKISLPSMARLLSTPVTFYTPTLRLQPFSPPRRVFFVFFWTYLKSRGDRSFQSAAAAELWKSLPACLRPLHSVETFNKQLKSFFSDRRSGRIIVSRCTQVFSQRPSRFYLAFVVLILWLLSQKSAL